MSSQAFICDAIRTPFGRYGGALSSIRTDDLGAIPLRALMARNPNVDWQAITDVIYGCANQAGEDNRNVAHMSSLLAGLPFEVPGATINRLCGSGLDAVGTAARAIRSGEAGLMIAGGVESMSRAPFVMPKAETAFSRTNAVYDTTIGWRFVNKLMKQAYGVDSMPETAENVATDFKIDRESQDRMALASQLNAVAAQKAGHFAREITAVTIAQKKGDAIVVEQDEHPRATTMETLAKLKGVVRPDGTVTAGNASGVNDGACALLLADEVSAAKNGLTPRARIVGMATAGVPPRIMGIGPAPATQKVLALTGLKLEQLDVIELNEAFAAQGLAVLRQLGLQDDDARVNAWGGAIALGHPLGASGARPFARHRWPLRAVHHVHWRGTRHCAHSRAGLNVESHRHQPPSSHDRHRRGSRFGCLQPTDACARQADQDRGAFCTRWRQRCVWPSDGQKLGRVAQSKCGG
jgi:3-oxoadipyl-CoA thiolase